MFYSTLHFQVSPVDETALFTQRIFVTLPLILQIYLPCHFGENLKVSSEKLSAKLFHSNWFQVCLVHKDIRIFMENLKQPVQMTCMKIFTLNLETFRIICKSAYSLFTFLQSMK